MISSIIKKVASTFAVLAIVGTSASAQVVVTAGSTYNQDFNSPAFTTEVADAGSGVAAWSFTNNSTYLGWMRQVSGGGNTDRQDKDFIGEGINGATVRFGNVGNGGSYSEPTTDRTLMSLVRDATEVSFGVVFRVSGADVTGVNVAYTGEQWFRAVDASTLDFQYKVLSSFDGSTFKINDETGWTDANALAFTSLKTGTAQLINGNYSGAEFGPNSTGLSATINLAASDGQYIAFRWRQFDRFSAPQESGLGVDDLSITFVPEPSTYALLAGLATLGLVMVRRRRQL